MVTHWNKEWGDGRGAEVTWVCVCLAHLWGQKHHFVKLCRRPSLTLTALEKSRVLVSPCAAPNSADPHLPPLVHPAPPFLVHAAPLLLFVSFALQGFHTRNSSCVQKQAQGTGAVRWTFVSMCVCFCVHKKMECQKWSKILDKCRTFDR